MANESQKFAAVFYFYSGGEVYTSPFDTEYWVVDLMGNSYSIDGVNSMDRKYYSIHIPEDEITRIYKRISSSEKEELRQLGQSMVIQKENESIQKFMDEILYQYPQYEFADSYDGEKAVLIHRETGKKFFLFSFPEYMVNETVSYILHLYRDLSSAGLVAPIYHSGIVTIDRIEVGYIIQKYVPTTFEDIIKNNLMDKDVAYDALKETILRINDMEIYNIPHFLSSFLYDPSRDRVYIANLNSVTKRPLHDDNVDEMLRYIHKRIYMQ